MKLLLATLLFASSLHAEVNVTRYTSSLVVTWDASQDVDSGDGREVSGVAGYRVYWGERSRQYDQQSGLVGDLTFTISNYDSTRSYFITVTAIDGAGNESAYGNEVSILGTEPPSPPTAPADSVYIWPDNLNIRVIAEYSKFDTTGNLIDVDLEWQWLIFSDSQQWGWFGLSRSNGDYRVVASDSFFVSVAVDTVYFDSQKLRQYTQYDSVQGIYAASFRFRARVISGAFFSDWVETGAVKFEVVDTSEPSSGGGVPVGIIRLRFSK